MTSLLDIGIDPTLKDIILRMKVFTGGKLPTVEQRKERTGDERKVQSCQA